MDTFLICIINIFSVRLFKEFKPHNRLPGAKKAAETFW